MSSLSMMNLGVRACVSTDLGMRLCILLGNSPLSWAVVLSPSVSCPGVSSSCPLLDTELRRVLGATHGMCLGS